MPAKGFSLRRVTFSFETAFLLITLLAFGLRFAFLDLKLFHHDEAIHAWFSYQLLTHGTYTYDPSYHGPLLYYVTAGMFSLLGDSDLVGRLVPSLLGAALVPLVYAIYRLGYLDRLQTLAAALFIAISPNLVYFSRFLRHDIFMLFFTLLLLVALLYYFERGRTRYLLLAAVALAGGLCCKEEMPIIALIFGSFFLFGIWKGRFTLPPQWKSDLVLALLAVAGLTALLYSSFGAQPEVLIGQNLNLTTSGWYRAIEHWTAMHDQCRLCGPFYFYIILFVLYEIPLLILAGIGTVLFIGRETPLLERLQQLRDRIRPRQVRTDASAPAETAVPRGTRAPDRRTEFFAFVIYWMVLSIGIYGYIGEKVPWLAIHQLIPMIFIAVYALPFWKPHWQKIAVAVSAVFLIAMTWHVAFTPADINEPIVQVQNSEDLRAVMGKIDAADRVAIASENYWPLPWYYRGEDAEKLVYYGRRVDENTFANQDFDLVIAHDASSYASIPGYDKETCKLNYWFSYYENEDRLLEYYFTRDGPMGSMNFDIFTRNEG